MPSKGHKRLSNIIHAIQQEKYKFQNCIGANKEATIVAMIIEIAVKYVVGARKNVATPTGGITRATKDGSGFTQRQWWSSRERN